MGLMCVTMPNFIKIAQTVAETWRFNGFLNGGICRARIGTTHEDYLVVFIEETDEQTDRYVNKKSTQNVFLTHAQIRNGRIDSNQILHINSLGGRSNIFDMT